MPVPFPLLALLVASATTQYAKAAGKAHQKQQRESNRMMLEDMFGVDTSQLTAKERRRVATGDPFMDIIVGGGQTFFDLLRDGDGGDEQQQPQGQQQAPQTGVQEVVGHTGIPPALSQMVGAQNIQGQQATPTPQGLGGGGARGSIVPEGARFGGGGNVELPGVSGGQVLGQPNPSAGIQPGIPVEAQGAAALPMQNATQAQLMGMPQPNQWLQAQAQQPQTNYVSTAQPQMPTAAPPAQQGPSIAEQVAAKMPVGAEMKLGLPFGGELTFSGGEHARIPQSLEEAITQAALDGNTAEVDRLDALKTQTDPAVKSAEALYTQYVQLYGPNDPRTVAAYHRLVSLKQAGAQSVMIQQPNAYLTREISELGDQVALLDRIEESQFWNFVGPGMALTDPIRKLTGAKSDAEVRADHSRNRLNLIVQHPLIGASMTENELKRVDEILLTKWQQPANARAAFYEIKAIISGAYQRKLRTTRQLQSRGLIPDTLSDEGGGLIAEPIRPAMPATEGQVGTKPLGQDEWDETKQTFKLTDEQMAEKGYYVQE